jgi:hypothetical protein
MLERVHVMEGNMKQHRFKARGIILAGLMVATPLAAASCAALPSAGSIAVSVGESLLEQTLVQSLCHGEPLNVCLGLG